jgi:hypothetical protein
LEEEEWVRRLGAENVVVKLTVTDTVVEVGTGKAGGKGRAASWMIIADQQEFFNHGLVSYLWNWRKPWA